MNRNGSRTNPFSLPIGTNCNRHRPPSPSTLTDNPNPGPFCRSCRYRWKTHLAPVTSSHLNRYTCNTGIHDSTDKIQDPRHHTQDTIPKTQEGPRRPKKTQEDPSVHLSLDEPNDDDDVHFGRDYISDTIERERCVIPDTIERERCVIDNYNDKQDTG